MRWISAAENAREEGRDCALERPGPDAASQETHLEWRERCRARIVREFESGAGCALCTAGASRKEFLELLAEWDRGVDETMNAILGSPEVRCTEVKRISVQTSDLSELLAKFDSVPDDEKSGVLLTCARLADDVARDLTVLTGVWPDHRDH